MHVKIQAKYIANISLHRRTNSNVNWELNKNDFYASEWRHYIDVDLAEADISCNIKDFDCTTFRMLKCQIYRFFIIDDVSNGDFVLLVYFTMHESQKYNKST